MTAVLVVTVVFLKLVLAQDDDFGSLTPYRENKHGSPYNHRYIRECHINKTGREPYEIYPAHTSPVVSVPYLVVKNFVKVLPSKQFGSRFLRGHYAVVSNPSKTFSVLEPNQAGGCDLNIRQTVAESSMQKNCLLAVNAGFFNTKNGSCLGNVVSDGIIRRDSGGIQNAHFGLTKDGNIFAGYLSQEQLYTGSFRQLIGGVVMMLKQGQENVNFSIPLECDNTEETGTVEYYAGVLSARTVVGHDAAGRIVIVQVDGKTKSDGASLYEMETLVKELGMVNAVNLDGGGSATFVVNGTVVNIPTDYCQDKFFTCSRKVSTILCVHEPYCEPADCSGHGKCVMGHCKCEKNWLRPYCDQLFCSQTNCSDHGICTTNGCVCEPGWEGDDCERECQQGWYGLKCHQPCMCLNNATCDHITGSCTCKPGFAGPFCQHDCPYGFYGLNCASPCVCENSCYCNPVTGACENQTRQDLSYASHCIALELMKEHLEKSESEEERKRLFAMIFQSAVTTISVTICMVLIFFSYTCYCQRRHRWCRKKRQYKSHVPIGINAIESSDSSSETEAILMRNAGKS